MNLHRAFPTAVNPMTTAWSDDAFHRVQVTLVYEWYDLQNFPLRVDTDADTVGESNEPVAFSEAAASAAFEDDPDFDT